MNEKNLHLSFLYTLGFTQRKLSFILDEGIDPTEVYCSPSSFFERLKITEEKGAKILLAKQIFDEKKHQEILKKNEVTLISKTEDTYPSLLGQLPNSPAILYVQGKLPHHEKLISVVGSRKHSPYAKQALEITLPGVLERGYEVVSGGAYGLDSVAHEMCVNRGKPTHIVLGSGIDLWYPRGGVKLFQQALDAGGSIISHFPLETLAEPYNFPIRNEVVAGISRGTLVAEAAEESGTLITARLALEMNRDVFVIPADISREGAWGSNQLIRDGLGKLTTSADDILCEYEGLDVIQSNQLEIRSFDQPIQERIYQSLTEQPLLIDEISEKVSISSTSITMHLSLLEVKGYIRRESDGRYSVIR